MEPLQLELCLLLVFTLQTGCLDGSRCVGWSVTSLKSGTWSLNSTLLSRKRIVHSKAARKPLVAIISNILSTMFYVFEEISWRRCCQGVNLNPPPLGKRWIKKLGVGFRPPFGLVAQPTKNKYQRSATQLESILCHAVQFSWFLSMVKSVIISVSLD